MVALWNAEVRLPWSGEAYGDEHAHARDARHLREYLVELVGGNVLQNVERRDEVERVVFERQRIERSLLNRARIEQILAAVLEGEAHRLNAARVQPSALELPHHLACTRADVEHFVDHILSE